MRVSLTGGDNLAREMRRALQKTLEEGARIVKDEAEKATPVRSGNARRNWRSSVEPEKFTVINTVPYIDRLEAGYSPKAPNGIIGPTISRSKGRMK